MGGIDRGGISGIERVLGIVGVGLERFEGRDFLGYPVTMAFFVLAPMGKWQKKP